LAAPTFGRRLTWPERLVYGASVPVSLPAAVANTTVGGAPPAWLPDTVTRWTTETAAAAERYGVDPALVAIVTTIESCGLRGAVSPAGALGLKEVVPEYHPRIPQGGPAPKGGPACARANRGLQCSDCDRRAERPVGLSARCGHDAGRRLP
jgi:soluble lytic murein transglycosylase-like protein